MLTIHVGLHKTGTTAIQRGLRGRSTEEFGKFRYLEVGNGEYSDLFSIPFRAVQESSRADSNAIARNLRAGHHVVLSNESFLGRPFAPEVGEMYSRATVSAAAICDFFSERTPFQMVIYLRAQHDWMESLYNQYAKMLGFSQAVDSTDFAERSISATYFSWTRLIRDLKEEVGPNRLIVRAYRPGMDVVGDFSKLLGIQTATHVVNQERQNPSLTAEQVALQQQLLDALEAADQSLTAADRRDLLHWTIQHAIHRDVFNSSDFVGTSMFTRSVQARLIQIAADDWQDLPKLVADTQMAEPYQFQTIAQDLQQARIKPYLGSLDEVPIGKEAIRLLAEVLLSERIYAGKLPLRMRELAMSVRARTRRGIKRIPLIDGALLRR